MKIWLFTGIGYRDGPNHSWPSTIHARVDAGIMNSCPPKHQLVLIHVNPWSVHSRFCGIDTLRRLAGFFDSEKDVEFGRGISECPLPELFSHRF